MTKVSDLFGISKEKIELIVCDEDENQEENENAFDVSLEVADGFASLVVRDFGDGVPEEFAERVFERFYRADKSRYRGGSGLGLSIVKHAAAYHKAEISLDSMPGKGTTITIQF